MNNFFDIINYDFVNINIDVKYKYLSYDESEDNQSINDKDILLKNNEFNSFMSNKINVKIKNASKLYSKKIINNDILDAIKNFENKNLKIEKDENDIILKNYFNSQQNIDDKVISFNSFNELKYQKKILSAYELNQNDYNIDSSLYYKNIVYSNENVSDVLIAKNNTVHSFDFKNSLFTSSVDDLNRKITPSDYYAQSINLSRQSIRALKDIDNINTDFNDQTNIINKFLPFEISVVSDNISELVNLIGIKFVGFYIKKYRREKSGENILEYVGSQFKYINVENNTNDINIELYDTLLNYSISYGYEVLPVFNLSVYKHNGFLNYNFPLVCHYLITTSSFKSEIVDAIDYFTPEPPNGFHVKPFYKGLKFELKWNHPTNPQNDVVGFQIYRRNSLQEPFKLIKIFLKKDRSKFRFFNLVDNVPDELYEISTDNSLIHFYSFIDNSINILDNKNYIYAVCSIDAHGMVSNYSTQIGVRYSQIYNNLIVDQVSMQNAPRTYPNLYVERKTRLFENNDILFDFLPNFRNKKKVTVYFTPDCLTVKNLKNNTEHEIFKINNQYQLNISRLDDLNTKTIKFKLNNQ